MRRKGPSGPQVRSAARPLASDNAATQQILAHVLFQDELLMVLNKPAGLVVHRGPGGGPSLEDWLPVLAQGKRRLPQPVHRLDMDTAGCLVLGRTQPVQAALGGLFAAQRASKTYWAVVRGAPPQPEGEINAPLLKTSTAEDGWRMVVDPTGQKALTRWKVLGEGKGKYEGLTWLELRPRTGRTHQLRAHCAHLGCPILGDARYGGGADRPLHLLARTISLPLDIPLLVNAPAPDHMRAALKGCGWVAEKW